MAKESAEQQSFHTHPSVQKLLAFVRAMIGGSRGREDDEHPLPPGPWDPIIRVALERIGFFGPQPEPWRVFDRSARRLFAGILARHPEISDAIGGGHSFGDEVALNPQPLPPRYAFLVSVAQALTSRVELLQDIADATAREGEQQGIIIVGGYVSRFVDDFCGTEFRLRYPFPGPRPHWFTAELDGIDMVVMAAQFEQAAKESFSSDLRHTLADVSTRLAEAGLSRMQ